MIKLHFYRLQGLIAILSNFIATITYQIFCILGFFDFYHCLLSKRFSYCLCPRMFIYLFVRITHKTETDISSVATGCVHKNQMFAKYSFDASAWLTSYAWHEIYQLNHIHAIKLHIHTYAYAIVRIPVDVSRNKHINVKLYMQCLYIKLKLNSSFCLFY